MMYDAAACRGFLRTGRGMVGRGFVAERRRRRRCRAALSLWYFLYTFIFAAGDSGWEIKGTTKIPSSGGLE